jgi:hypothetical protein
MSVSFDLWQKLPDGFLKKKYRAWCKLDHEVQSLIVELASDQNFRCAFCSRGRNPIIEHDHDPEQGRGDHPTIYNVRGLACHRCNLHLGLYEVDKWGGYRSWDHVDVTISSDEYDDYIDAYARRLRCLHEDTLEKTCSNYWSRRLLLDKFDDWKDGWRKDYPWYWDFEEIKEKRHGTIRTPEQFIKTLTACVKSVAAEYEKDPNYQPSDEVIKFVFKAKEFLEPLRPLVEARLKERNLLAGGLEVGSE